MDINWTDEIPGSVQGTPVNRLRLMGMQGYFPGTTSITEISDTVIRIVETSTEGQTTTTITENTDGSVTVDRTFVASDNMTIRKITTISTSENVTNVSDVVQG